MWSIDTLLKKIRRAGTIDRQPGSGRPRSVCVNENTKNVEDIVLSQEDNPKICRIIPQKRPNRDLNPNRNSDSPITAFQAWIL